jgi:hypothetical protein
MPLVARKIVHEVSTTFAKIADTVTRYVPPNRMRPGDRIVEPTNRQLAELAALYPTEYGKLAKERGVSPVDLDALRGDDDAFEDFDEGDGLPESELDEAQLTFLELPAGDAADFLRDNKGRHDFLAKLYAAEVGQAKPRASVVRVFKQLGIGSE